MPGPVYWKSDNVLQTVHPYVKISDILRWFAINIFGNRSLGRKPHRKKIRLFNYEVTTDQMLKWLKHDQTTELHVFQCDLHVINKDLTAHLDTNCLTKLYINRCSIRIASIILEVSPNLKSIGLVLDPIYRLNVAVEFYQFANQANNIQSIIIHYNADRFESYESPFMVINYCYERLADLMRPFFVQESSYVPLLLGFQDTCPIETLCYLTELVLDNCPIRLARTMVNVGRNLQYLHLSLVNDFTNGSDLIFLTDALLTKLKYLWLNIEDVTLPFEYPFAYILIDILNNYRALLHLNIKEVDLSMPRVEPEYWNILRDDIILEELMLPGNYTKIQKDWAQWLLPSLNHLERLHLCRGEDVKCAMNDICEMPSLECVDLNFLHHRDNGFTFRIDQHLIFGTLPQFVEWLSSYGWRCDTVNYSNSHENDRFCIITMRCVKIT